LRRKTDILKKADFNDDQIRNLMEEGICGKKINITPEEIAKRLDYEINKL
jgi:hypothetical protein